MIVMAFDEEERHDSDWKTSFNALFLLCEGGAVLKGTITYTTSIKRTGYSFRASIVYSK